LETVFSKAVNCTGTTKSRSV